MNMTTQFQINEFINKLSQHPSGWIGIEEKGCCNRSFSENTQTVKYCIRSVSPTIDTVFFTVNKENNQYKIEVVFSDEKDTIYELPLGSENFEDLKNLERDIISNLQYDFQVKIRDELHL